jgi:hypothetical protein
VVSKNTQRQQKSDKASANSVSKSLNSNSCKTSKIAALSIMAQERGVDVSMSASPIVAQTPLGYGAGQTASSVFFVPQPSPFITVDSLYAVPGSILLSMDYRFVYLGVSQHTFGRYTLISDDLTEGLRYLAPLERYADRCLTGLFDTSLCFKVADAEYTHHSPLIFENITEMLYAYPLRAKRCQSPPELPKTRPYRDTLS